MPTTLRRYAVEPQDLGCLTVYSIVVSHVMVILTWAHAPQQASSSEGVKPQPRGKWALPTLNICTPGGRRAQASCCLFRDALGSGHTAFLPMGILLVEYQFHIIPPPFPPPSSHLLLTHAPMLFPGEGTPGREALRRVLWLLRYFRSPVSDIRSLNPGIRPDRGSTGRRPTFCRDRRTWGSARAGSCGEGGGVVPKIQVGQEEKSETERIMLMSGNPAERGSGIGPTCPPPPGSPSDGL